jgi:putative ABC transport system substrate-binding protein
LSLAAELVELDVDLIVTSGTPPTRAAQQATRTTPVAMTLVSNPVAAGFVASLAKPGGTSRGLATLSAELGGKRIELLKMRCPPSPGLPSWPTELHRKRIVDPGGEEPPAGDVRIE